MYIQHPRTMEEVPRFEELHQPEEEGLGITYEREKMERAGPGVVPLR